MDSNLQESIALSLGQTPTEIPGSTGHKNGHNLISSSNHFSQQLFQNSTLSSPSYQSPINFNPLSQHNSNENSPHSHSYIQQTEQYPRRSGNKRATQSTSQILEAKSKLKELPRHSMDITKTPTHARIKALQERDPLLDSPFILKEYRYRKLSPDMPSMGEKYCVPSNPPSGRRKDRAITFFPVQEQIAALQQNSPKATSRTPSNASRSSLRGNQSGFGTGRESVLNTHRFSHLNNASLIKRNLNKESDFSDDDGGKSISEEHLRIRKIFKKGLHVVYFIGIMFSLRTRVKMFGALRPIEYLNDFESYKPPVPNYSRFPILPSSCFSLLWTFLMVLLLITTAIITPVYVSFVDDDDEFFSNLNLIFDILFGVDILINFISAYYDSEQNLIRDFRLIALNYLQAWFWIDIVAILPFDQIILAITQSDTYTASGANKLLRLLRFPRLYRMLKILRLIKMLRLFSNNHIISKIIKELNLNIGLSKILKIFINFAFLNHVVGCLWFFVAKLEDFTPDTWVGQAELTNLDTKSQYIASLYWAFQTLTTVGYGDITPGTQLERVICAWWPAFCVAVYSFLVGNLATILLSFDKRSDALKNDLASLKSFALQANLPEFLRQRVQRFIEVNHKENSYYMIDPNNHLKGLPVNLRTSLLIFSYYTIIKNIKLLQVDPAFTAALVVHLKVLRLQQGEILYRQDDPSREVFFISSGSVKFITEKAKGIYSLSEGTYFGEIEVLEKAKRQFFCQAENVTVLLVCPQEAFLQILENFPQIEKQIRNVSRTRKNRLDYKLSKVMGTESPGLRGVNERKTLYKTTDYINKVLIRKSPKLEARRENSNPLTHIKSHVKLPSLIEVEQRDENRKESLTLLDRIKAIRIQRQNTTKPKEKDKKEKVFMKKALSQVMPYKEDTVSDNYETNYMQSPTSVGLLKRASNGGSIIDFNFSIDSKNKPFSTIFEFKQKDGEQSDGSVTKKWPLVKKETIFFEEGEVTSDKERESRLSRRVRFQETPIETPPSTVRVRLLSQNKASVFNNDLVSHLKKKIEKDSNSSKEDNLSS